MGCKSISTVIKDTNLPRQKPYSQFFKLTLLLAFLPIFMWQCKKDDFKDETKALCPLVLSTDPTNGETNVVVNKQISATFNVVMDSSTINASTFEVMQGADQIFGTVTYSGYTAYFTPSLNLKGNTVYSARITTGAHDPAENALEKDHNWTFTTGTIADTTRPIVILTDPFNGESNVALNKVITATFNEAMNATSLNGATFLLKQGTTSISGAVSYSNLVASFDPTVDLNPGTVYSCTITTGATDAAGNGLLNNYNWSFTTGLIPDNTPPTVILTDPIPSATNVPLNKVVRATFSESMNPLSINGASFTLKNGAITIPGTITYVNNTASFTPTNPLSYNTTYTATVTNAVTDAAGNNMVNDYVWSFTTLMPPDAIPPTVISTDPANNAINVPVIKTISAVFSENMDPLTITTTSFTLYEGLNQINGAVSYAGVTAQFNPTNDLNLNTVYTATIKNTVKDLAGNTMVLDYVWNFTTALPLDAIPPTVISTDPANNATNVALNKTISAVFSENMEPTTISITSFTISRNAVNIAGAVSYSGVTAQFNPTSNLLSGTVYTGTITTAVKDLAGNNMVNNYVWTFTTVAPLGPAAINLDCAAGFAVLAGSAVTNTGNTVVDGDLGLSPGSSVSGFPPGQVINGSIRINDAAANNAKGCLTTAYNDGAGRSNNVIISSTGQLGGLTLAPGLYQSAPGSFSITGSDLTLDAQGDINAVWIFQMPSSTLTVGNGIKVTLSGGAQAGNIYWIVGSSATIGTTAEMKGNILADQSITLQTGASLLGRALTRIAAVTLDNNAVTKP
ncbi:MAG: Ig-like domain-containing protein [Bacteroidia bacterium]